MKKIIISLLLVIFTGANIYAQSFEPGIVGGGMYYLGDINSKSHFNQMKSAVGVMGRYNLDDRWSFKFSILKGSVSDADSLYNDLDNDAKNIDRGLHFRSSITEIGAMVEFNFWPYEVGTENNITPYIFGGVSAFFFHPEAINPVDPSKGYDGLRKYGTEGQLSNDQKVNSDTIYSESAFSIPFGIGIKYSLTDRIGLSVEWGLRKTFTDYLDDISTNYYLDAPSEPNTAAVLLSDPLRSHYAGMQRGNPETKDWYAFFGVSLTYKFNLNSGSCAEF